MATTNKFAESLNALFKDTYADKVEKLIPTGLKLMNLIKFMAKDKQPGNLFIQPVILGHEHGVTFAASDDDAFALNAAITGSVKDAQVRGNPILIRSLLGYTAAQRASQGKAQAFEDATKFVVANMIQSISKKLEIELFYGQMGYGQVGSVLGNVVTVKTAEWAPGIWAGAENMPVEFRDATGATSRGEATITSVSLDARSITVNLLPAGVVADDVIWHKGAYGKEFAGLHKILTNTGELFNINASTYSLWKGNSYDVAGALSLDKVEKAVVRAVEKGLEGDVTCFVSLKGWTDLLSEQTALRQFDSSYNSSKLTNGGKAIEFFGVNGGSITIEPSIYVKEGYAFILYMPCFMRVGSTDVTLKMPGDEDQYIRHLSDNAGFELRAWSDQALFCHAPGKNCVLSGIVNVE